MHMQLIPRHLLDTHVRSRGMEWNGMEWRENIRLGLDHVNPELLFCSSCVFYPAFELEI